ncbi:MAG: proteasome accessory factor PafA2 [Bifidobacteriaceae bacterium]|jgi:proteasome accessory factor A|nr:proteasome accessory factor PafA2 [Bifidobacteriaceae bacterium]
MGIETEYAITSNSGDPTLKDNPIELSYALVGAAASAATAPVRWDYRPEDPVNDARGYRLPRASARPEMLTDVPELRPTNVVAPNGGRIYVDHAHPEYSSPETMSPQDATASDRAGDGFMQAATQKASQTLGRRVSLYRNNTDGKGSSWGSHESYQVKRSVPFDVLSRLMTAHFVSRQIYTGAGRVGIGEKSETPGFQISQRADFFHARIGLQTTFDRPIINTRDESHSTEEYRRLHVIVGDANRMDVPEVLKLGTTSLLAWVAENAEAAGFDLTGLLESLELLDPVESLHAVSHDLSLGARLKLAHGGDGSSESAADSASETASETTTTAWQMQVKLRSAVYAVGAAVYGTDSRGEPLWPDEETRSVLDLWGSVLGALALVRRESDDERLADTTSARSLEWLLKWQVLEGMRRRKSAGWDAAVLAALDLSWADCDPAHSVFSKVESRASSVLGAEDLEAAKQAPEDTRAWLRAELIRRFPHAVAAASWKQITLRMPTAEKLLTVDISDSKRFSKSELEEPLRQARTIAEVATVLTGSHTMK